MPKLKKFTPQEIQNQFQNKKKPGRPPKIITGNEFEMEVKKASQIISQKIITEEKPKYLQLSKQEAGQESRRKRLAKSIRAWLIDYLESRYSVRDFERWRKAKPGEALPWAWKAVYGDGATTQGIVRGQVNVLIQLLTGQQPQGIVASGQPLVPATTTSVEVPQSIDGQPETPQVIVENQKPEIPPGTPTT